MSGIRVVMVVILDDLTFHDGFGDRAAAYAAAWKALTHGYMHQIAEAIHYYPPHRIREIIITDTPQGQR